MRANFIRFDGVEALRRNERELLCRVLGGEVWVPCDDIALDDCVVQQPGDRGSLVMTRAAAARLGLVPADVVIAAPTPVGADPSA